MQHWLVGLQPLLPMATDLRVPFSLQIHLVDASGGGLPPQPRVADMRPRRSLLLMAADLRVPFRRSIWLMHRAAAYPPKPRVYNLHPWRGGLRPLLSMAADLPVCLRRWVRYS
jgi:hypothetical protein